MGHQLTGRWLIDPIKQCRGAARTPLVPEVKGFSAAVGDKAEGDANAGFGGDFMFRAGAETGQKIQRGRLQAGLFAAWFVVLQPELEVENAITLPVSDNLRVGPANRPRVWEPRIQHIFVLKKLICGEFIYFGLQLW